MVHNDAHEAALQFEDTWKMLLKLSNDIANAKMEERFKKGYPPNRLHLSPIQVVLVAYIMNWSKIFCIATYLHGVCVM